MDLSWIINHLGEERERYFDAVIPPIVQSAIFAHPDIATMRLRLADEFNAHVYTRGQNPTVEIVAKKLAALEGAERRCCSVPALRRWPPACSRTCAPVTK